MWYDISPHKVQNTGHFSPNREFLWQSSLQIIFLLLDIKNSQYIGQGVTTESMTVDLWHSLTGILVEGSCGATFETRYLDQPRAERGKPHW
jgi:hypothetical protein